MTNGNLCGMSATHWAEHYIGKPWINGAQGPDAFDCWGLVRNVYDRQYQIALPVVQVDASSQKAIRHAFADSDEYCHWDEIDSAAMADGDVVLMGHGKSPHHVGLVVNNAVLHAIEASGVVLQGRQSLAQHGWNILTVYRRRTQ